MNNEKWLEKLKIQEAFCYIKPSKKTHEDTGFRCFEVGYLIVNKTGLKIKEKIILTKDCDSIQTCGYPHENKVFLVRMDLLLDGYIRLWHNHNPIWWGDLYWLPPNVCLKKLSPKKLEEGVIRFEKEIKEEKKYE